MLVGQIYTILNYASKDPKEALAYYNIRTFLFYALSFSIFSLFLFLFYFILIRLNSRYYYNNIFLEFLKIG